MIPLDDSKLAKPRPGELWIQRDENHIRAVGIVIPDHVKRGVEHPISTVFAVGVGVEDFKPGDRVLVRPSAGRIIRFGERGELVLRVIKPSAVLADVLTEDQVRINIEEHQFRGYYVPQELVVEAE
jgi:hypothetical protein